MGDSKKKYKVYTLIMEYAWLTIAISSLLTACVDFYYHGINSECVKFIVLCVLSFAMFIFRRKKRLKENNQEDLLKKN